MGKTFFSFFNSEWWNKHVFGLSLVSVNWKRDSIYDEKRGRDFHEIVSRKSNVPVFWYTACHVSSNGFCPHTQTAPLGRISLQRYMNLQNSIYVFRRKSVVAHLCLRNYVTEKPREPQGMHPSVQLDGFNVPRDPLKVSEISPHDIHWIMLTVEKYGATLHCLRTMIHRSLTSNKASGCLYGHGCMLGCGECGWG